MLQCDSSKCTRDYKRRTRRWEASLYESIRTKRWKELDKFCNFAKKHTKLENEY